MRAARSSPFAILPAFALASALALDACSSSSGGTGGSTCSMGEQKACICGSTTSGTQTCLDTGVFGACACPAADSGGGSDAAGDGTCNGCGDGGGLPDGEMRLDAAPGTFGAPCMTAADCSSMDCNPFPAKGGSFCTQPCEVASDCPAQALGCNGMGQCKVP